MRLSKTTAAVFTAMMALPVVSAQAQQDTLAPTGRWSTYTAGRAQTPPMGWSSWNAFATDIDESKILGSAEALVRDGLAAKGYRYVNIDDGWALQRRVRDGALIIRPGRFPITVQSNADASFRPLTDRLHGMGLKAGIYSDLGRNTCSQAYSPNDTDLRRVRCSSARSACTGTSIMTSTSSSPNGDSTSSRSMAAACAPSVRTRRRYVPANTALCSRS